MHSDLPRRRALGLLAFGALGGTSLLQGCNAVPATLRIGVAGPLTGDQAPSGYDLLNGVNLAAAELNQQGFRIQGQTVAIEVLPVDDRADIETGKLVAQQLVDAGVVAVIGHLNSGVSMAAAPIYADQHIAQLTLSTNPKFTALGFDNAFRLVANDSLQAKAMGSFSLSQFAQASRYAVADDNTPYGKDLADSTAAQLVAAKKSVLVRQSLDDKTTKMDELAQAIKDAQVEVVISTLSDFQTLALLEALKKIDYTHLNLLGSDTIKSTLMLTGAGLVDGLYATSPILDAFEFPAGAAFLEKYRARFKVEPAYAGHYTYDAMHVLAAAIKRAESAQPQKIVEALHVIDGYAPVTGSMKWTAQGELRYGVIASYNTRDNAWESLVRSDNW